MAPAFTLTPARGVVQVMVVELIKVTPVASIVLVVPPRNGLVALAKRTVGVPPAKPVPVMMINVGFSESTTAIDEAVTAAF